MSNVAMKNWKNLKFDRTIIISLFACIYNFSAILQGYYIITNLRLL